jgi:hypothetical protein
MAQGQQRGMDASGRVAPFKEPSPQLLVRALNSIKTACSSAMRSSAMHVCYSGTNASFTLLLAAMFPMLPSDTWRRRACLLIWHKRFTQFCL